MVHTFDVRFASAGGLDASLLVDPTGISVTPRRGIFFLLRRTRRIRAADIRQVYREGELLRVEYGRSGAGRDVLPLWARDRETAARIVDALPTTRTVEVEASPRKPTPKSRRTMVLVLISGAAGLFIGAVFSLQTRNVPSEPVAALQPDNSAIAFPELEAENLATAGAADIAARSKAETAQDPRWPTDRRARVPVSTEPAASPVASAVVATVAHDSEASAEWAAFETFARSLAMEDRPPPSRERPIREGIVAFIPGDEAYTLAVWQLELFERDSGRMDWWSLTERISTSETFQHPDLNGMRDTMLGISRAWRRGDREFALRLTRLVRLYVY